MPHQLSKDTIQTIVALLDQGKSLCQIIQMLGISLGTAHYYRTVFHPNLPKSRGGRPRKLKSADAQYLKHLMRTHNVKTARKLNQLIDKTFSVSISTQTVRRELKRQGMKAVVKQKGLALTAAEKHARLEFAKEHEHWTVDDWKHVIFSDETVIYRIGNNSRQWVWVPVDEEENDQVVQGRKAHGGGNFLLWGCFSWEGVGVPRRIDETQQDDVRHHLPAKKVLAWFKKHDIVLLEWPANSPDLNPIENLWGYIKEKLNTYPDYPAGMLELWERVEKEWEAIGVEYCRALVEGMPKRMAQVIRKKGGVIGK
ncbi:hypothetical protein ACG7TL_007227 [Trametes sanguinea]